MSTYRGSITFCFLHFNSQVSSFCGPVFKKPGLKQAHASGLAQEQRGQEMCFHTRERWTRRSKGEPSIHQDWGRAKQDSIWTGPIVCLAMVSSQCGGRLCLCVLSKVKWQLQLPFPNPPIYGEASHPCYEFLCTGNTRCVPLPSAQ